MSAKTELLERPFSFEISARLSGSHGRAGVIHAPHGDIKTPAFLTVGTNGYVRYVSSSDLLKINAQAMLSNGYHLRGQAKDIAAAGGLSAWSGWNGPTVTDSGGFQIMSLGSGMGKVVAMSKTQLDQKRFFGHSQNLVNITDDGVHFTDPFTGQPDFIDPETSMYIQCQIGADIHMAFDELTSLADDYDYNVIALRRTHDWAKRSLAAHDQYRDLLGYRQSLYGVLQGGHWEDLRRQTASFMAELDFDGYGLGGAFVKEDLGRILDWCNSELPELRPRHLLGLSHPDDILIGAEMGADTFDCVAPTREARHGRIYTRDGNINLRKFADSDLTLDQDCDCPTCQAGFSRGQLRALWKSPSLSDKEQYYNLASIHNLRFIIRLTEEVRSAIIAGNFFEYKQNFLARYQSQA